MMTAASRVHRAVDVVVVVVVLEVMAAIRRNVRELQDTKGLGSHLVNSFLIPHSPINPHTHSSVPLFRFPFLFFSFPFFFSGFWIKFLRTT